MTLDFTLNVPTILIILGVGWRLYGYINRIIYKLDIMWTQFLIEHPEYERREHLRTKLS